MQHGQRGGVVFVVVVVIGEHADKGGEVGRLVAVVGGGGKGELAPGVVAGRVELHGRPLSAGKKKRGGAERG